MGSAAAAAAAVGAAARCTVIWCRRRASFRACSARSLCRPATAGARQSTREHFRCASRIAQVGVWLASVGEVVVSLSSVGAGRAWHLWRELLGLASADGEMWRMMTQSAMAMAYTDWSAVGTHQAPYTLHAVRAETRDAMLAIRGMQRAAKAMAPRLRWRLERSLPKPKPKRFWASSGLTAQGLSRPSAFYLYLFIVSRVSSNTVLARGGARGRDPPHP